MQIKYRFLFVVSIVAIGLSTFGKRQTDISMPTDLMINTIHSAQDVVALFPTSPKIIKEKTTSFMAQAEKDINAIIAIPSEERTFKNTAQTVDRLTSVSNLGLFSNLISVIQYVHPDKAMRDVAQEMGLKIQAFWVDNLTNNTALYEGFKAYVHGNAQDGNLSTEQRYFLDEEMLGFKRSGLELPDDQREKVTALQKELTDLSDNFMKNIAEDDRTVTLAHADLAGINEDTIASFKQDDDGNYILGIDYPTYFAVMENCTVSETRKKMYRARNNHAYPINEPILKQIIAKKDTLAKLLGYSDYATYDTENVMVGTPQKARNFLNDLLTRSHAKAEAEIALLKAHLPPSITLSKNNKFYPWDLTFASIQYKKKHLDIDEEKIAEYFPMKNAIDELLDIYSQFLSVEFKRVPTTGLWHNETEMIVVYSKNDTTRPLGYLILDLFPRHGKYTHACHMGALPGVLGDDSTPAMSVVLANFKKPTATKPSLLKLDEVRTFFHEFGHAMHALLGTSDIVSFSGTSGVKRDFVEMPSQMLEEWFDDADILKKVSSHYLTGEPLSDKLIKKIVALKTFDTGSFVKGQSICALLALDYFAEGADKDPNAIYQALRKKHIHHTELDQEAHMFASFSHLMIYGSKYYGYLWSKVFALDMFEQIEKAGLLNPQMGQKYVKNVIGRGGSAHPDELLHDFLGRKPTIDAFMRRMGLEG